MLLQVSLNVFIICVVFAEDDNWLGNWFPYSPESPQDTNPSLEIRKDLYDPDHGVVMGIKDKHCDDAKTNLEIDWNFSPINYTCFIYNSFEMFKARSDVQPLYSHDVIPEDYSAPHRCMDQVINYAENIPTYGVHRPLWAKWGEYTFLPKQRWVHNLEHGGIVLLYHPCADKNEVHLLKSLVKSCLYRHIITPYNLLSTERPLALVAWGYRLEMSKVSSEVVLDFIRQHALKGPEQLAKDGQYDLMLDEHADIVSDINDKDLCGAYNFIQ